MPSNKRLSSRAGSDEGATLIAPWIRADDGGCGRRGAHSYRSFKRSAKSWTDNHEKRLFFSAVESLARLICSTPALVLPNSS